VGRSDKAEAYFAGAEPNKGMQALELTRKAMDDLSSLGQSANHVLSKYIEVHNDIFGSSLWRTIRRTLPIPGFFQAIPYAAHAATLAQLRFELGSMLNIKGGHQVWVSLMLA
jgi:hypothetical protein